MQTSQRRTMYMCTCTCSATVHCIVLQDNDPPDHEHLALVFGTSSNRECRCIEVTKRCILKFFTYKAIIYEKRIFNLFLSACKTY